MPELRTAEFLLWTQWMSLESLKEKRFCFIVLDNILRKNLTYSWQNHVLTVNIYRVFQQMEVKILRFL